MVGELDVSSFRQGSRIKERVNEKVTKLMEGAEKGVREEKSGDIMYRVRAIRLLKTVVARCE